MTNARQLAVVLAYFIVGTILDFLYWLGFYKD